MNIVLIVEEYYILIYIYCVYIYTLYITILYHTIPINQQCNHHGASWQYACSPGLLRSCQRLYSHRTCASRALKGTQGHELETPKRPKEPDTNINA
jgi:hypothetical protein